MNANDDPRPEPPADIIPTDCCGGGCDPCVLETHEEELEYYRKALAAWLERHPDTADAAEGG